MALHDDAGGMGGATLAVPDGALTVRLWRWPATPGLKREPAGTATKVTFLAGVEAGIVTLGLGGLGKSDPESLRMRGGRRFSGAWA